MKLRSGSSLTLYFWSHRSNCWKSYYNFMEVFKCCKTCIHVLVEDDHRYSICSKPALDDKSIDLSSPNANQASHLQTARQPSYRPSSCHSPGHLSPARFRRVELEAAKLIQHHTGLLDFIGLTAHSGFRLGERHSQINTTFGQCEAMWSPEQTQHFC